MPLRFLFVTQYFPPERGAAQVRIGAVTDELTRRGHRVEVLTSIPNYPLGVLFPGWPRRPFQSSRERGIRVRRVWVWAAMGSGLGRAANFLSFGVMSGAGLLRRSRPDWTVVEYPTLFGALPAVVWSRIRRAPVAVNVSDLWVDSLMEVGALSPGGVGRVMLGLERWMLRRANVVNAVTVGVRKALEEKGVDPDRILWLPNGADVDLFAPGPPRPEDRDELGLEEGEQLFVYAGTQGYVHGLEVVLDAAAELRDEQVKVLLVGGGSERERLEADARHRELANVVFWDPVSPERVAELLRTAVAGIACTRRGDVYRTVRSAKVFPVMASGLPVIYSGDDEGAALVASVGAGIATPAGDGPALAAAIRRIISTPSEGEEMGARGRAYAVEEASWQAIVARWLAQLDAGSHGDLAASAAGPAQSRRNRQAQ